MSTLDSQNVFGSGPHSFRVSGWQHQMERRTFPGVSGELVLDLGLRARTIVQRGRLQASTPQSLATLVSDIESFADGQPHVLVDNYGRTFASVLLQSFEPTTPLQQGVSVWCDYEIHYLQLP